MKVENIREKAGDLINTGDASLKKCIEFLLHIGISVS